MAGSESLNPHCSSVTGTYAEKDEAMNHDRVFDEPKVRHSTYFFDDVPVIFEVEGGVLFKVHKYFLERDSPVFRTMFSCPPDSSGPEGATEDKPIVLPGVKSEEFEALLDYFYQRQDTNHGLPTGWAPKKSKAKFGATRKLSITDRLVSLLSIATRFDFEKPREFAIDKLETKRFEPNAVKRILLSRQFEVGQWLKPAYVDLCQRDEPLSFAEAEELGLATTVLMAKAREAFVQEKTNLEHRRRDRSPSRDRWGEPIPPPKNPLEIEAERIVTNVFFPAPPTRVGSPISDISD